MKSLLIVALIFLSGCSSGIIPLRPRNTDVDELEKKLYAISCVGNLDGWERVYWYRVTSRPWDSLKFHNYRTIDFILKKSEYIKFDNGRHIYGGVPNLPDDDRKYTMASGNYDLIDHKLSMRHCGSTQMTGK